MKIFDELKWRGLIQDISSPDLEEKLNNGCMTFYWGTDPTADSLHIGHYASCLMVKRLMQAGHKGVILVGGATALVGDPRGTTERALAQKKLIENNVIGLKNQIKNLFGVEVVNNYDWIKDINLIDFLRDYGKHISIGYMLGKDIIKRQLESGLSYAEFTYTLLQGYDFKYLHDHKAIDLQVAGSDQWGNITTGIELIRRIDGQEVFGLTTPLITDSRGVKFGKSEGNAIWLDKDRTSPYQLYQYLINAEDSTVIKYLKMLTLLSRNEIEEMEAKHNEAPHLRLAQKLLAFQVVKDIHGEEAAQKAKQTSEEVFANGGVSDDMPSIEFSKNDFEKGKSVLDLLVDTVLADSRSEAKRLIQAGAVYFNRNKITDIGKIITINDLDDSGNVLQKGKKNFIRINVKNEKKC